MILLLQLSIERAVLLYQQDTACHVTITNVGPNPVGVMLPEMDPTLPIVRVVNVRTGVEDTYRRSVGGHESEEEPLQLPPGQRIQTDFTLLELVPELAPGEYEVSVAWEYQRGPAFAESDRVRVKVLPTTPKNLNIVDAVGGRGDLKFGVWVNLAEDPPHIVRSSFDLSLGGGVADVLQVAEANLLSRPVLSAPASRTPLRNHWIAWIDGTTFNYTHVHEHLGILRCQHMKLSEAGTEIVASLYSDRAIDTTVRPEGSALLCQSAPAGTQFRLQTLQLTSKKAAPRGEATFAGPKPLWIFSHVRSAEQRLVTYLQAEGTQLALHLAPWPGVKSNLVRPNRLAEWTGGFLAADATLGEDDTIRGALLMRNVAEDRAPKLVLVPWTVSERNTFQAQNEHIVQWEPTTPIRQAQVRVSDEGLPGALIADGEGIWHVYDGRGKLQTVPSEFQKTKQPIELAFMDGLGEPLLICGTLERGFRIICLDGSPLPPKPPK